MASFTFNSAVPNCDTTFVFGSWVCIANGSGGFDSHLDNPRESEAIPARRNDTTNHSDDLGEMLLPDLAKDIEEKLVLNASSSHSPINLRSKTSQSKIHCAQTALRLHNTSSVYRKMIKSI